MLSLVLLSAAIAAPAAPAAPDDTPAVRSWVGSLPRTAPHGKARVWPLAEGSQAWVGRLELEPGARVPAHRDPTEETIVVLSGGGSLTLDGVEHTLTAGSTVLMPANAEVSFTNGPERLVAIQVFAGPEPADKYAGWASEWHAGPLQVAHDGPLSVACRSAECFVFHRGAVLGEPVWNHGAADDVLQPLGGIVPMLGQAWLLRSHAGDGCPSMYEAVCLIDGAAVRSERFGNCNDPAAMLQSGDGLALRFPGSGRPGQVGHRPQLESHLDPRSCGIQGPR